MIYLFLGVLCGFIYCTSKGSVYYDETSDSYTFVKDVLDPYAAAHAYLNETAFEIGYETFILHTNETYSDAVQSFAAGYAEGMINADKMLGMKYLIVNGRFGGAIPQAYIDWLDQNKAWVDQMISENPSSSYWQLISCLYKQTEGILRGFNEANSDHLSYTLSEFMTFSDPDSMFLPEEAFGGTQSTPIRLGQDHCTGLLTLTPGSADVLFAHNLWFNYGTMMTQYKEYHFHYSISGIQAQTIYQSGWAGMIDSCQHFIMTSSGLTISETSLDSVNSSVTFANFTGPQSLYTSFRTVAASRLATSASNWIEIFKNYNCGLFNSNWFIFDMSKFTPEVGLSTGAVYMLEQMPNIIKYKDMSSHVNTEKYLASYNAAYFPEIIEATGYTAEWISQNPVIAEDFNYTSCARAEIFARDHANAVDVTTMKAVIRYDDWQHDEYSGNYSNRVTCARPEQSVFGASCSGCIDGKIISANEWKNGNKNFYYINSPPYTNNPVWVWSESATCSALQPPVSPDEWDFDWTTITCGELDYEVDCGSLTCVNGHCGIVGEESGCVCDAGWEGTDCSTEASAASKTMIFSFVFVLVLLFCF